MPSRQQVEHRLEFRNHIGEIALGAPGCMPIEETANPSNTVPRIERFLADLLEHFGSRLDHRLRPVEHAAGSLREGRHRADGLIQLVRDAARHLLQRGNPCNLKKLLQQDRSARILLLCLRGIAHRNACRCLGAAFLATDPTQGLLDVRCREHAPNGLHRQ